MLASAQNPMKFVGYFGAIIGHFSPWLSGALGSFDMSYNFYVLLRSKSSRPIFSKSLS